jgi:hypothetical protein
LKTFGETMRDAALKRRAERMVERKIKRGEITQPEIDAVERACNDPVLLSKWNKEIKAARLNPYDGTTVGAINWSNVIDWFAANWVQIVKLLFSLLIMLDKPEGTKHANS